VIGLCPSSSEYKSEIVDSNTIKPILLFCKKSSSEHHIGFSTLENSKSVQSIAEAAKNAQRHHTDNFLVTVCP
jgi:hypothetical protein